MVVVLVSVGSAQEGWEQEDLEWPPRAGAGPSGRSALHCKYDWILCSYLMQVRPQLGPEQAAHASFTLAFFLMQLPL